MLRAGRITIAAILFALVFVVALTCAYRIISRASAQRALSPRQPELNELDRRLRQQPIRRELPQRTDKDLPVRHQRHAELGREVEHVPGAHLVAAVEQRSQVRCVIRFEHPGCRRSARQPIAAITVALDRPENAVRAAFR